MATPTAYGCRIATAMTTTPSKPAAPSQDAPTANPDDLAFVLAGRMQRRKRRGARNRFTGAVHAAPAPPNARRSPTQRAGDDGEDRALALLGAHGLTLLARNLSCALGEVDLVMREGDTLVFVEVRARRSQQYGGAAASIGPDKRQRLTRAAQFFLPKLAQEHWQGNEPVCRFDVVVLENGAPHWLRGALDDLL